MKERMCVWQETVLDLMRNVYVSLCLNAKSDVQFDLVHKERCENCSHRERFTGEDEVAESLVNDVYIELAARPDETIEQLLDTHCKQCDHYAEIDGICSKTQCEYPIPIRELIRNPDTHCELGLW